jgi:hypothetical protein
MFQERGCGRTNMKLTVTTAENGFVVEVEEPEDSHYYFVALDVADVCGIIENLLVDTKDQLDMTNIAFEAVHSDR